MVGVSNPSHLLEVIHPTQLERFEVDARCLRTARIVTLVTPQSELTSVTRYEHDDTGQLMASTLPDGSRLAFERNGQQQVVALNWMVRQATDAGVNMNTSRLAPLPTGNLVLHDPSNAMNLGDPRRPALLGSRAPFSIVTAEDREVRGAVRGTTQRTMAFDDNSMSNADTHTFIAYRPRDVNQLGSKTAADPATMGNVTGTVDMTSYLDWLRKHGYVFVGDKQ